jgi:hypothetical protein
VSEFFNQLEVIELSARLLEDHKRVLLCNFSAVASIAGISHLNLSSTHPVTKTQYGLAWDKGVARAVVLSIYTVATAPGTSSTPSFGNKILMQPTAWSSHETPATMMEKRKLIEVGERSSNEDIRDAFQSAMTEPGVAACVEKLAEDDDGSWKLDDYPSLLEALERAPDKVKDDVNVILSSSYATGGTTELLRTAVGPARGATQSVAGIGLSYVFGDDAGCWTHAECLKCVTFQAFFTHIVGCLSQEHKDLIPDSVFHSVGLKGRCWAEPYFDETRHSFQYGHGKERGTDQWCRFTGQPGASPEKVKQAYWDHINRVANDKGHAQYQYVRDVLDIVFSDAVTNASD